MSVTRIQISGDDGGLERAERMLAGIPGGATRAVVSALNRASQTGRTTAVRQVTQRYTLKAGFVRNEIHLEKASSSNLVAGIKNSGKPLPLSAYLYKPKKDTTGRNRQQVYVSVKKDGMKPLARGFVWGERVMQRAEKGRRITRVTGPALPVILNNEQIRYAIEDAMTETFDKRLEHEISRLLNKNSGGA